MKSPKTNDKILLNNSSLMMVQLITEIDMSHRFEVKLLCSAYEGAGNGCALMC